VTRVLALDGEVLETALPVSGLALLPVADMVSDCAPLDVDVLTEPDGALVTQTHSRNTIRCPRGKRADGVIKVATVAVAPESALAENRGLEFAERA
jgi:hypothetical protein